MLNLFLVFLQAGGLTHLRTARAKRATILSGFSVLPRDVINSEHGAVFGSVLWIHRLARRESIRNVEPGLERRSGCIGCEG